MKKTFRKMHGQQFFFVTLIGLFYLHIMVLILLLITNYPNLSEEFLQYIMDVSVLLLLCGIPSLSIIALIIFAISRIWAEPYATLADDYMIVDSQTISYQDIQQLTLSPGTWRGHGRNADPYGPAIMYVYFKNSQRPRLLDDDDDFVMIEGVSYLFCYRLKAKCPQATFQCKHLVKIFLLLPLLIGAGTIIFALLLLMFPQ